MPSRFDFSNLMTTNARPITLRQAAFISGITILVMAIVAPFAELYVYPKLVVPFNALETARNIKANKPLFVSALFAYLVTGIGDVVLAWSLYILLEPVNRFLSSLTALFRLVYGIIFINALLNLVTVFRMLYRPEYLSVIRAADLDNQVLLSLDSFRASFHFGIIFFAIHLLILGYLAFRSGYVPRFIGLLVILTGLGYLTTSLQPYLFSNTSIGFVTVTYFGELVFMIWLIFWGSRLPEAEKNGEQSKISSS